MPVADLTREWFESELLCASIAGPAVSGAMMGPRSAGSGLVLLLQEAHRLLAGGSFRVRGGPGAMTVAMAIAAHDAGAEIRRGSTVERIIVKDEQVVGVVADGTRDSRDRRRVRGGPEDDVPAAHGPGGSDA